MCSDKLPVEFFSSFSKHLLKRSIYPSHSHGIFQFQNQKHTVIPSIEKKPLNPSTGIKYTFKINYIAGTSFIAVLFQLISALHCECLHNEAASCMCPVLTSRSYNTSHFPLAGKSNYDNNQHMLYRIPNI